MQIETIETPRLLLRKITPEVYAEAHAVLSDGEKRDFFGLYSEKAYEREMRMLAGGPAMFNKSFLWFHLLDKDNGKNIGWCGYHTWHFEHFRAEIGYGMHGDEYRQKGLMTEALKAVLDYGFDEMKLHRIEAYIADYNIPSLKLVDKFGFVKEGVLREHYFVDGVPEPSVLFSLLKHEYRR